MSNELHVSSLIVQVLPEKMAEVRGQILKMPGAELSVNNEVKLVVVLEGNCQKELLAGIEAINALPGVMSATMVYHQSEVLEEDEQ
ncbi:chaperone NapD [Shewanella litorisediminis]|uniref:Chaperone NapD n=1 Tax=Shewanella litorisediminis TaxID=1173586 RepID=A0ABX7G7Z7_9GAMM|nr:chaperone NapD [Shewanella litorisediminis]MCL2919728.1 chaperone NapD [Shewanella litorisediminis]QRH03327.1 chaperone NapD [Shewanella litorisediminis]